jgi:hypothetical protein
MAALENQNKSVGGYAADEESYEQFAPIFD